MNFKGKLRFVFPHHFLDSRIVQHQDEPIQVLVQLQEGRPEASTWEDVLFPQHVTSFEEFNIEDKVVLAVVGSDRLGNKDRVWNLYHRKKFKNNCS